MTIIKSKKVFYELWNTGILGNKSRTWDSLKEAKASTFAGTVAIRYRGNRWGGPLIINLNIHQLENELDKLTKQGWQKEDFNFSEQLSPDRITYLINGEVMRGSRGLELFYATENKLMREALGSSGRNVYGMQALEVLHLFLWPPDIESLMELLDIYPDHVVEFSGFDRKVGVLPNRRMIVWEVRLY
ncbi:MAG: hypothetical protein AAB691_00590 [Patescibacteria group bacterium]